MSEDSIQDLKQFITAEISGQLKTQRIDIKDDIKQLEVNLIQRIEDLETKLDTSLNHIGIRLSDNDSTLNNHEKRIFKLESLSNVTAL